MINISQNKSEGGACHIYSSDHMVADIDRRLGSGCTPTPVALKIHGYVIGETTKTLCRGVIQAGRKTCVLSYSEQINESIINIWVWEIIIVRESQ